MLDFCKLLESDGTFTHEIIWKSTDGVQREILLIKFKNWNPKILKFKRKRILRNSVTRSYPKNFPFSQSCCLALSSKLKLFPTENIERRKIFTRFSRQNFVIALNKLFCTEVQSDLLIKETRTVVSKSRCAKFEKIHGKLVKNISWKFPANIDLCQQCWIRKKFLIVWIYRGA